MPVRLVFAGERKSLQKFVLLLPEPAALAFKIKLCVKKSWAGEVTLTWKKYVLFPVPPERLRVMFVSSPSCMRVGETDNE